MAPKRWSGPPTAETRQAPQRPHGPASSSQVVTVEAFVKKELSCNNVLGLTDEEITGAAKQITTCTTKKEVFEWCSTMMLGETIAAEVVKRRDDCGPSFAGSAATTKAAVAPSAPALPAAPIASSGGGRSVTLSSGGGKAKRGAKKFLPQDGSTSSGKALVEGQFFECGCFAMSHPFAGNCLNCGRIFCKQESLESCYYCGLDPRRCIAYEIKSQTGIIDEAACSKNREGLRAAIEKRDQLLKYAKEKSKRTTVIDDQSGVFLESRNGWLSTEERAAAEDAEAAERRRKIALHHRRSGAYTVHLDIVNQNVALGARVDDLDDKMTRTDVGAGEDDEEETRNEWALEDEYFPELDVCDDVVDDEDECDGERRVLANPAVVLGPQPVMVTVASSSPPASQTAGGVSFKAAASRVIHESIRLQNDYYSEDKLHWAKARSDAAFKESLTNAENPNQCRPLNAFDFSHVAEIPANFLDNFSDTKPAAASSSAHLVSDDVLRHFEDQADLERHNGVTKAMRKKDDGMCLSMHQPWASLLIAGIKTHEGRIWSSEHRGRLWIHAAAAKPSDVASVENHYAKFCPAGVSFPTNYPTSCLLGYVYVTDCLDHAGYLERFSEEQRQEDSPFKFICTGATALPMPLAMEGKHKIFKMDRKLWIAAKRQLGESLQ